ncbi:hypothetical protein H0H93_008051 [Arthromyces matolae]|nr:hypothetical protein H0H93_008051 [Arthromyces matolae]
MYPFKQFTSPRISACLRNLFLWDIKKDEISGLIDILLLPDVHLRSVTKLYIDACTFASFDDIVRLIASLGTLRWLSLEAVRMLKYDRNSEIPIVGPPKWLRTLVLRDSELDLLLPWLSIASFSTIRFYSILGPDISLIGKFLKEQGSAVESLHLGPFKGNIFDKLGFSILTLFFPDKYPDVRAIDLSHNSGLKELLVTEDGPFTILKLLKTVPDFTPLRSIILEETCTHLVGHFAITDAPWAKLDDLLWTRFPSTQVRFQTYQEQTDLLPNKFFATMPLAHKRDMTWVFFGPEMVL